MLRIMMPPSVLLFFFFFFNDTATTEIYTLSLHDALPISARAGSSASCTVPPPGWVCQPRKRLPSYSSPKAIRRDLAELREQLLRRAFLRCVAVLHDLVEQVARPVLVSHFLVRLGEVELGRHLLPL